MSPIVLTVEELVNLAVCPADAERPNVFVIKSLLHILIEKLNLSKEKVELEGPGTEVLEALAREQKPTVEVKAFSVDPNDMKNRQPIKGKENVENELFTVKAIESKENGSEQDSSCCEPDLHERIHQLENMLRTSNDRVAAMHCEIYELRRMQDEAQRVRNHKFLKQIMDECQKCKCDDVDSPNIPFCVDYSDPFNELVLGLLSNKDFLIELMKRISCPILDKVSNWENQLQLVGDLFQKFIDKADEEFRRLPTPEMNAAAIAKLREDFENFLKEFILVVGEIQDMLDAKLDKVDIVAFKKYVKNEFIAIKEELEHMKKYDECPDALGTTKAVFEDVTCFSCAGTVCQRSKPRKSSVFGKAKEGKFLRKHPIITEDHPVSKRACGGAFTVTDPAEKIFRGSNLADEFGVKIMEPKVAYLQGTDGNMYRAEPEVPICVCHKKKEPKDICPCPDHIEEDEEYKFEDETVEEEHTNSEDEKKKKCPSKTPKKSRKTI